ncbi:MAG: polyribonucleotide nucleotidyltransferase, partial [Lentisphaeria bacterium]
MSVKSITIDLGNGRPIEIQTGRYAAQANGAITIKQGDTTLLVAAVASDPNPGQDFFPLQVDYREKYCAAGKFPGGFMKREGRPSDKEILTMRMTDRPLRPLFPKGFMDETQVYGLLLSYDEVNQPDVLNIFGASCALMVSDIPFNTPLGALRVGRINGQFVANPTQEEMKISDLDLVYAGVPGKTIMIEGDCDELSEEELRDALYFADEKVCIMTEAMISFKKEAGKADKESVFFVVP